MTEIERLRAKLAASNDLLLALVEEFKDALGYVPPYFREKWDYDRFLADTLVQLDAIGRGEGPE